METALQSMPNSFEDKNAIGIGITISNIGDYEPLYNAIVRLGGLNQPIKKIDDFLKKNRIQAHTIGVRGTISVASGNLNVT